MISISDFRFPDFRISICRGFEDFRFPIVSGVLLFWCGCTKIYFGAAAPNRGVEVRSPTRGSEADSFRFRIMKMSDAADYEEILSLTGDEDTQVTI